MSTRHRRCSLVIPRVMRRHLPLLHALLTYRNCLVVMSPWRCNLSLFSFFLSLLPFTVWRHCCRSFVTKTKRTVDITEKKSDWLTALTPMSGDGKSFKLVQSVDIGTNSDISKLYYQPFPRHITFPIGSVHCERRFELKYWRQSVQSARSIQRNYK